MPPEEQSAPAAPASLHPSPRGERHLRGAPLSQTAVRPHHESALERAVRPAPRALPPPACESNRRNKEQPATRAQCGSRPALVVRSTREDLTGSPPPSARLHRRAFPMQLSLPSPSLPAAANLGKFSVNLRGIVRMRLRQFLQDSISHFDSAGRSLANRLRASRDAHHVISS